MKDQVSIIIPVYNSEKYLKTCVESIIKQTYSNIEIILIDDGSTDHSYSIIAHYQKKYPQMIKGFTQQNQGVAKTRNRGIHIAHGEYLMFADNDDYMEPEYVEIMLRLIKKRKLDMLVGSCRKVNSKHKTLYEYVLSDDSWAKFRMIAPWARIMRKDFVVNNKIEFGDFKVGEDSYFAVTAYNSSDKIGVTQYIGYNWVHRKSSVSNTVQKKGTTTPIPFLTALIQRNREIKHITKEELEYFVMKFLVWNLIYVSHNIKKKELFKLCKEYFDWMNQEYPNYKKNKLVKIYRPKGEQFYVRLLIWLFVKSGFQLKCIMLRILQLVT